MAEKLGKWASNRGLISKIRHRLAAKGIQFPRRWYGGMISANLEVIWAMSVQPHPDGNPPSTCATGSRMRTSAAKPEGKRLDESVQMGFDQTHSWVNPSTETKNCAQIKRQMPEPRYSLHGRLDWAPKQPNMQEKAFYLGNVGFGD